MSIYGWFLVILVTSLAVFYGVNRLHRSGQAQYDRYDRLMLRDRLDQAVTELPRAGRFQVEHLPGTLARICPCAIDRGRIIHRDDCPLYPGEFLRSPYGPFPADTGPLLILSEKAAANDALEREIRALGDEAERKIGPVR